MKKSTNLGMFAMLMDVNRSAITKQRKEENRGKDTYR